MTTENARPWDGLDILQEITIELPVELTDEEFMSRARSLALQEQLVEDTKAEHKAKKKELAEELDQEEQERRRLGRVVREGKEPRNVLVHELGDYKAGVVYQIRTDTGAQVATRRMTADERQLGLDQALRFKPRAVEGPAEEPAAAPQEDQGGEAASETEE